MARSLTVNHDEKPATSALFTGFLVLAIGWLLLSTFTGANEADAAPAPDRDVPIVSE